MFQRVLAVFGMPRSGTSWVGQILDSSPDVAYRLEPIFAYAFKDRVGEDSSGAEFQRFFEDVYRSRDAFMLQAEKRAAGTYPTFEHADEPAVLAFKTTRYHNLLEPMLERCPELRLAVIVRHPCGAIHSWLTATKEFPPDADPSVEWRTGRCRNERREEFWGFEDWKVVTRLHLALAERFPRRVLVQRYEDLVADPAKGAGELFAFGGLELGPQTTAFLSESQHRHSDDQHAVFKDRTVATRWERELDPGIRDEILGELRGTDLGSFLS